MKAKTIKAVLRKKIDAWAASIEDESVRDLVKKNTIVTGGAIASMLLREPVNDYDVYFRDYDTTLAVANYYLTKFNRPKNRAGIPCNIFLTDGVGAKLAEIGPRYFTKQSDNPVFSRIKICVKSSGIASEDGTEKPYEYFESRPDGDAQGYVSDVMQGVSGGAGTTQDLYEDTEKQALDEPSEEGEQAYRPVFLSTNAITLSGKVQVVIRFWGSPEDIHENYDFVHCTNYWQSWDNNLVLRQEALEALLSRELRYVGSRYPLCSIIRLRKFIARGWTVNAGQILKMAMQLQSFNLNDINVLEDQLTGVDQAYFLEVINKLKEKGEGRIESAYLIEIIDRMF